MSECTHLFNAAIATSQSHSSYLMNLSSAFSIARSSARLSTSWQKKVQRSTFPSHLSYDLTPIFNTSTCIHQSKWQGSEHTCTSARTHTVWGIVMTVGVTWGRAALVSIARRETSNSVKDRLYTHLQSTYRHTHAQCVCEIGYYSFIGNTFGLLVRENNEESMITLPFF